MLLGFSPLGVWESHGHPSGNAIILNKSTITHKIQNLLLTNAYWTPCQGKGVTQKPQFEKYVNLTYHEAVQG